MSKKVVADKKSVLASGLLSFFFGPIGWFYAAPLEECGHRRRRVPALRLDPASVHARVHRRAGGADQRHRRIIYAVGYNTTGERLPIFGGSKEEAKRLPSRKLTQS